MTAEYSSQLKIHKEEKIKAICKEKALHGDIAYLNDITL